MAAVTSVGFVGSGRLAERIARRVVKHVPAAQKFSYKRQRLVSTLLASDPLQERRRVFDELGFTTTAANQDVLATCDVVFLGTSAREALAPLASKARAAPDTLFVSLMGDMRADQVEQLLSPGAKVIRMMPQSYLEANGLPKGVLPPRSWAAARGSNVSAQDVERVVKLTGIRRCVEVTEHKDNQLSCAGQEGLLHLVVNSIGDQALAAGAENPATQLDEAAARIREHETDFSQDFQDLYAVEGVLGEGKFARVFKAKHRVTGREFAVKCLKNKELSQEATDMLVAEVGALSRLKHPNVIAHHGFYSEGDNYYLVLDYCKQGSIRTLLDKHSVIPEHHAKRLIKQMVAALAYCHSMGQVHRDVKAENVMLVGRSRHELTVKLADFGLSEELELGHSRLQDICGTPQYLSPEIVSGRLYGKPADIWSAGILSYMMLSGIVPFEEAVNESSLHQLIRLGAIWYNQPAWADVSPAAKSFVQRMLDINPETRATAEELLAHEWLQS